MSVSVRLVTGSEAYAPFVKMTSNFTAVAGGVYGMDTTSASITCTPISSPQDGDWFIIFDVAKK